MPASLYSAEPKQSQHLPAALSIAASKIKEWRRAQTLSCCASGQLEQKMQATGWPNQNYEAVFKRNYESLARPACYVWSCCGQISSAWKETALIVKVSHLAVTVEAASAAALPSYGSAGSSASTGRLFLSESPFGSGYLWSNSGIHEDLTAKGKHMAQQRRGFKAP